MAVVFVPSTMRTLSGGVESVVLEGRTVRELIEELEVHFPGARERLVTEGRLRTGLSVSINGQVKPLGLLQKVDSTAEVHFIPAIGGG